MPSKAVLLAAVDAATTHIDAIRAVGSSADQRIRYSYTSRVTFAPFTIHVIEHEKRCFLADAVAAWLLPPACLKVPAERLLDAGITYAVASFSDVCAFVTKLGEGISAKYATLDMTVAQHVQHVLEVQGNLRGVFAALDALQQSLRSEDRQLSTYLAKAEEIQTLMRAHEADFVPMHVATRGPTVAQMWPYPLRHTSTVDQFVLSDGRVLVSDNNQDVHLCSTDWSVAPRLLAKRKVPLCRGFLAQLADGRVLVARDVKLGALLPDTLELGAEFAHYAGDNVLAACQLRDGLIVTASQARLYVWNPVTCAKMCEMVRGVASDAAVSKLLQLADGRLLVCTATGVQVWNLSTHHCDQQIDYDPKRGALYGHTLLPDDTVFAVDTTHGAAAVCDVLRSRWSPATEMRFRGGFAHTLKVVPLCGARLLILDTAHFVIWDVCSKAIVGECRVYRELNRKRNSAGLLRDGRLLLGGYDDGSFIVYHV